MTARSLPLGYRPYHRLGGVPNVVVDGSPTTGTVLTLSHWPRTPCPASLEADLSAEMAFAYLQAPNLHGEAEAVSNNHFDQDGLVSLYALTQPESALARRQILIDLAAVGDFATYQDRTAARASMVIAVFADSARSPLGELEDPYEERTSQLYVEMLGRLDELVDHPERYRHLWAEEDEALAASEQAITAGQITIEETAELDLAVVTVAPAAPTGRGHRFAHLSEQGPHPMAINNATSSFVVATVHHHCYQAAYRYETWVQYRSRRPRPRVDLSPLAAQLTDMESGGHWVFDGVDQLTPRLYLQGALESAVPPEEFLSLLRGQLDSGLPAWDPYAIDGRVEP